MPPFVTTDRGIVDEVLKASGFSVFSRIIDIALVVDEPGQFRSLTRSRSEGSLFNLTIVSRNL
jgi:hypothetical protein